MALRLLQNYLTKRISSQIESDHFYHAGLSSLTYYMLHVLMLSILKLY